MNKIKLTLLSIFISVLMGCTATPTTQIGQFGDATKSVTDEVNKLFDTYQSQYKETMLLNRAAYHDEKTVDTLNLEELSKMESSLKSASKTFAILKANKQLGQYAKALSNLSNAGAKIDVDYASANLFGALYGANETYQELSESDEPLFKTEKLATFTSVIAAIGYEVAAERKRKALKAIIQESDPIVTKLVDVIVQQINDAGISVILSAHANNNLTEKILEYRSIVKNNKALTTSDKQKMLSELLAQYEQRNRHDKVEKTLVTSLKTIKSAHSKLAETVKNDKFSSGDIAVAIGRLKDMEKEYESFRTQLIECESFEKKDGKLICNKKKDS